MLEEKFLCESEKNCDKSWCEVTEMAVYDTSPEINGNGTFFFTECRHKMYSVKDDMAYHGCLCPGCLTKGKQTILYKNRIKRSNDK